MASLNLPNTISPGNTMDPRPIQANFDEIESKFNTDVIHVDGSRAMTAALTLVGAPTAGLHAATKQYVDAQDAVVDAVADAAQAAADAAQAAADSKLPLTGGTVTGHITRAADPTSASHLARKSYVDSKAASYETSHDAIEDAGGITAPLTTSYKEICSITKTVSRSTSFLICGTADFGSTGSTGATCVGELRINGVAQPGLIVFGVTADGQRATVAQNWATDLGAGTHTFKLYVKINSGSGFVRDPSGSHTKLNVIAVG